MQPLPIDPLLGEICRTAAEARALVLEAPPGAGKTTRVPAALLAEGVAGNGEILVAEPRRLAARLAAHRVADEHGERVGQTVGYSVRFEEVSSRATRIRFVTEGVLVRRLLADPKLFGVTAVMLDEFHERHVATDLCLTLLERLRRSTRPDLVLIVTSATLEAEPVARFVGCPRIRSEGRSFPVEIVHLDRPDDRPLEKQVVSAVRRAIGEQPSGDVLVFLPGAAEIRRSLAALAPLAESADLAVLPLHGDLPIAEQARAIEPARRRKVVLSTNVAESSVTIPGVTLVVDSGLSRQASHSPWTGLSRLSVDKISRASAAQRAGRAGRTAPGRVYRLYTKGDHDLRREHDAPEITRLDLSETLLVLHGSGIRAPGELAWLDPPPPTALGAAETLLGRLGALDASGALTEVGRRLLELPLHPRLARLIDFGERHGIAERASLAAALLGERDIRMRARALGGGADEFFERGPSDVLWLLDRFDQAAAERFDPRAVRSLGLDAGAVKSVERARRKLERSLSDQVPAPADRESEEQLLSRALLAAFPDRVARRAKPGSRDLVLCTGGSARLAEASVVVDAPLLLAIDVEDRAAGRTSAVLVRLASAIEPEWLLDAGGDLFAESDTLGWNAQAERVDRVTRLSYGSVLLEETRAPAQPSDEASRVLARAASADARRLFGETSGLTDLVARIALLRAHVPEAELPDLGENPIEIAVIGACAGRTSYAELRAADLCAGVLATLPASAQRLLREEAPERLGLPGGRNLAVHYEVGKPPFIESRLQDFFGMRDGPRVCRGRVPVVLHLLAPNQRAVQVTTDLAGFWQRHYPSIRRELCRRYPKHAWPEDGASASPPPPRARR